MEAQRALDSARLLWARFVARNRSDLVRPGHLLRIAVVLSRRPCYITLPVRAATWCAPGILLRPALAASQASFIFRKCRRSGLVRHRDPFCALLLLSRRPYCIPTHASAAPWCALEAFCGMPLLSCWPVA